MDHQKITSPELSFLQDLPAINARSRFAFVTIIANVSSAHAIHHSLSTLRGTGSHTDAVLILPSSLPEKDRFESAFGHFGVRVYVAKDIQEYMMPSRKPSWIIEEQQERRRKLLVFRLTMYERVAFFSPGTTFRRNPDELFSASNLFECREGKSAPLDLDFFLATPSIPAFTELVDLSFDQRLFSLHSGWLEYGPSLPWHSGNVVRNDWNFPNADNEDGQLYFLFFCLPAVVKDVAYRGIKHAPGQWDEYIETPAF
jgi:hypothetical protein